jgi:colanic acid/amylovoran biosynthesis protein
MKVFVTFGGLSWQKGSAAQLISLTMVMRAIRGDIRVVLESHAYDLDEQPARELGIEIVGHRGAGERSPNEGSYRLLVIHLGLMLWAVLRRIGCNLRFLARNEIAQHLLESDLVADLSGDSYRDRPGGIALAHTAFLLSALVCKKPVVIVSQSLGPFRWYSRALTRVCLNRLDRIYVRERRTVSLLREMGVSNARISLAPDVAFCLPPAPEYHARRFLPEALTAAQARGEPVVGISTSSLLASLCGPERYEDLMARIIRFVRRRYGAVVLLVPHVVTPSGWGSDDSAAARRLVRVLGGDSGVYEVTGNPGASELKWVISQCELLLAARMHAAIAGLSSNVPTIMLSWSHKYSGLMQEIGLEQCVWEIDRSAPHLERLVEWTWERRGWIRELLAAYNGNAQIAVHDEVRSLLEAAAASRSSLVDRQLFAAAS